MDRQDTDFDRRIERRGTGCAKWDLMGPLYGVPPEDGIAMWVADTDFAAPDPVRAALAQMADHGVFGYPGDDAGYREAIRWWMATRHGWQIAPGAIFSTHGLVNAVGLCLDTFSDPGDGVVLFTPVYHAFARLITAAGRTVVECPLARRGGRYGMDLAAYDALIGPRTRLAILCSPHNPGGTVWRPEELRALADFARRHDLLLLSDEIHHDLVFPGARHLPMARAAPEIRDRLVTLCAASKTFNIAGAHIGNVVIEDPALHARFDARLKALGLKPNAFGLRMVEAAYSPDGAAWCDALVDYLDGNRRLFDAALAEIPGAASMPLEATYLAWVDFAGTGLSQTELLERVQTTARIAANHGETFGTGGAGHLRFNLGAPRGVVREAANRLVAAFADLQ